MEPLKIKTRPLALFPETGEYAKRCEGVIKKAMDSNKQGVLPEDVLEEVRCFPEAFKALVLYPPLQEALIQDLTSMPHIAYDVITADYEQNAPYLETAIYNCPELIYKLLLWAKETDANLRYPHGFYNQLLLEDVVWAIRWNVIHKDEKYHYFLLDFIEDNRFSEAGSACLYLQLNPKEDAELYSSAIAMHWKYSLLASYLFAHRGIDINALQQEALLQPQWAYHFAKYIPKTNIKICEATLLTNPSWLAEYLTDVRPERRKELGALGLAGAKSHPLWADFKQWFKK